ncbi:amidohydrolase family protein [Simiduia aestuariiviva]|uniref:Amidohydrolase-related domain-containing protein n=1 Tax=Simiduia aestuariiviva TaxID=1510459 RepID=A0A839UJA0_9GAMM|nr:amidohydrolase family protein [Simiduia aestuariiviva]MBB3166841.1 hypothetical protein [Simiduia aestuariiviva]
MVRHLLILLFSLGLAACIQQASQHSPDNASTTSFVALYGGSNVGYVNVTEQGNRVEIAMKISNNGRGPETQETVQLDSQGIPQQWQIVGNTTFGNEIDETFVNDAGVAQWRSAAGEGRAGYADSAIYVAQNASVYAPFIYANAMLKNKTSTMAALPSGELSLKKMGEIALQSLDGTKTGVVYALSGIELAPDYLVFSQTGEMIARISPRFVLAKTGFEQNDQLFREFATSANASRFENIAKRMTHDFDRPVRIVNVRIFEPQTLSLSEPKSVLTRDNKIIAIDSPNTRGKNEVIIDGQGGTLIPGLYEMHGHMSDDHAIFNVLAGVTSVRDMGNEIDVIEPLIEKIASGQIIGPRITKSGFIEGDSEFSSATGEKASSQEQAVQLVNDYAARGGYHQIKIYSSINGDWVPAMAAEAKKHGMRVAGHIPAFSKADEMIAAGYDEITHINQVMLSWVLDRKEDTRTLFRITGMKRFVDLDLNAPAVQKTLDTMVSKNIAVDPTMVIHEFGLTGRNGEVRRDMRDYVDHMPIGVQRDAKVALLNVADEQEDQAYLQAFDKIIETLSLMHKRGIFIVPGTDMGGAFKLHRELELFTQIGMTPAEAVRRGSYDMAKYLGYGDELGSIEVGKLADFFLVPGDPTQDIKAIKTISLVASDGRYYFPTDVYPEFGIRPFTEKPKVYLPQ